MVLTAFAAAFRAAAGRTRFPRRFLTLSANFVTSLGFHKGTSRPHDFPSRSENQCAPHHPGSAHCVAGAKLREDVFTENVTLNHLFHGSDTVIGL